MQKLSSESERQILGAIRQICDGEADGLHPTQAAIKVAKDLGLTRHFIELVGRGYNSGAAIHQRESNSSALSKFASLPLVDVAEVIEACYPSHVQTPAQKAAASVDACYAAPPRLREPVEPLVKAASIPLMTHTPERLDPVRDAYWQRQRYERELQTAREKYAASQERLLEGLAKLASWLHVNPHRGGEVAQVAQLRFGKAGEAVLDCVRFELRHDKVAWASPAEPTRVDWQAVPYNHLADCVRLASDVIDQSRTYRALEAELTPKIANWAAAFKPPVEKSKYASFLGSMMGSGVARWIGDSMATPKETSDLVGDTANELDDPVHQNELRKIQAQTMLHDLMNHDEVISGYEPDEVLGAYNELASLSPRSSTQMAIVRPLLRKRLTQGAMEPFEAAEMANIEKTLSQSRNPPPKEGALRAFRRKGILRR